MLEISKKEMRKGSKTEKMQKKYRGQKKVTAKRSERKEKNEPARGTKKPRRGRKENPIYDFDQEGAEKEQGR